MAEQHPGSNGIQPEITEGILRRLLAKHDERQAERSACGGRCAAISRDMKGIIRDAHAEHGLSQKALRLSLKGIIRDRELQAEIDELEPDDADSYEAIQASLGEDFAATPLGEAALKRARAGEETLDTLNA